MAQVITVFSDVADRWHISHKNDKFVPAKAANDVGTKFKKLPQGFSDVS